MKQTGFPLVSLQCRQLKQHTIVWCGIALCCQTNYVRDEKREPRSYTLPRKREAV